MYEKPVVIVNEDLAEGVFAASGAIASNSGIACTISDDTQIADWGNGTGQRKCKVDVPNNSDNNIDFYIEFTEAIEGAWGLGGQLVLSSDKMSGTLNTWSCQYDNTLTYQGPTSARIKSVTRVQ